MWDAVARRWRLIHTYTNFANFQGIKQQNQTASYFLEAHLRQRFQTNNKQKSSTEQQTTTLYDEMGSKQYVLTWYHVFCYILCHDFIIFLLHKSTRLCSLTVLTPQLPPPIKVRVHLDVRCGCQHILRSKSNLVQLFMLHLAEKGREEGKLNGK